MGIYIPNVEMPRGCNSCPLVMEIDNTCSLTMGGCTKDERPPHCPLIEIEEWNSYSNGKIYAPKGTFQKIYDAERRNDE